MGNNLAKIRGKHQITQTELAKKIGVTKQGLCFNEKGKCSVAIAEKVANYLGENIFSVLGTDSLVTLPLTAEDKAILIGIIEEL